MHVCIGHILFPPTASTSHLSRLSGDGDDVSDVATSNLKRFKGESWTAAVNEARDVAPCRISADSIAAAVRRALEQQLKQQTTINDIPDPDVYVHAFGKGASFCFVPGILTQSLTASAFTTITSLEEVTVTDMETAERLPRITEVSLVLKHGEVWSRLPVYWEERQVVATNTTATAMATSQMAVNGCAFSASGDASHGMETLMGKRILVVGAGGIGCELLKVLVLCGFRNLDVIDLDTIDATNLNRQFLFQKEDVGASKADTACKVLLNWFASTSPERRALSILAHHADIKSEAYDDAFFRQFALVLNALDNVSARQHVNRMCMRTGVPLIESGTMGYNGQVQPIVRGLYECYDCHPKAATQQTVAVCTIHARPTTMVHCVHYAKELYERLFGDEKREEKDEFAFVDAILMQQEESRTQMNSRDGVAGIFGMAAALARCVFHDKIHELLSMKSVWATQPPVPIPKDIIQRSTEQVTVDAIKGNAVNISRDTPLSVEETVSLFIDAFTRCARCGTRGAFRKEDDNTVDFVAAVANLRATVFHIFPLQSVEEIRSIAGAIVPAIATTNAIVAAVVVQQALCVLGMNESASSFAVPQMVYVRRMPQVRRRPFPEVCGCNVFLINNSNNQRNTSGDNIHREGARKKRWITDLFLVHSTPPNPPSRTCLICRERYPTVRVFLDATRTTLGQFVCNVLRERLSMTAASVFCGAKVLYEEGEYEALAMTPLAELMTADNKLLELFIDSIDHEVEWRLMVNHRATMQECDAVELEGVDAAIQLERTLAAESKIAVAAEDADNGRLLPSGTTGALETDDDGVAASASVNKMATAAENGAAVVVVPSDSDEEGVDVVEVD
ncbi:ubiquitin-activating enzyme-like protein [Trypanosoma rangeli]|uniref:Ubiquitin-activating enzyme-like protein n=1 Tax=Trypanosoma rangeli TaxID=5698 RepID=A0A3R7MNQ1_TRYRA|nr:ubiquitin-activating enzyme-like protein [Trypanosoma rangeli]RNF08855.1 ubiquitin-activating enzyme-like protein [Trypanosoma rangeli]|eukprot:RNF08855.1 ubiquitin-activating enzyme-like protein [Trypanosoma rangeli]